MRDTEPLPEDDGEALLRGEALLFAEPDVVRVAASEAVPLFMLPEEDREGDTVEVSQRDVERVTELVEQKLPLLLRRALAVPLPENETVAQSVRLPVLEALNEGEWEDERVPKLRLNA